MHLSIRAKVFLTVAVSLIVIFAVTMLLIVINERKELQSSLNQESKSFAALATTPIGNTFLIYQDSGTVKINQQVNNYLALDPDVTSVSVIGTDGSTMYSTLDSGTLNVSSNNASSFSPVYKNSSGYTNEIIYPFIESTGVHSYAVVYQFSTARVQQNVTNIIQLILAIGVAVLVLSIAGTQFMLNRFFIKPIRLLSQSAYLISNGKYDEQIVSSQKDEIGSLAQALNKMASSLKEDIIKLQDLDKMKSEFMAITSHNLRTPLTVLRGYIELAESIDSVEEFKNIISTLSQSVSQLNVLAENMLTISTIETGYVAPSQPYPISNLINSTVAEFAPLAKNKGITLDFKNDVPAELNLSINQANMHSALAGIIDNAIKFTDEGGSISVTASVTTDQLLFQVKDSGVGIAPEEMPKLFTKFHRGTDVLNYNYEGLGIGLYLGKLIIQQHGGDIKIESELGKGTTCTINIPINKDPNLDKTETKQVSA